MFGSYTALNSFGNANVGESKNPAQAQAFLTIVDFPRPLDWGILTQ
jgi:hypothetical protein